VRGQDGVGVDAGMPPAAAELAAEGIECRTGEDGIGYLDGVRTLVKSPGVPAQAPIVEAARERGLTVLGELELAWRLLPNELIAVTGTNGKTTTVELIGHVYRTAGLPVAVAGNVGVALSGLVGGLASDATVVCEVSSFQAEDTLAFAPQAAVLLNLGEDHLDRHGTMDAYREAKLRIFANQGAGDLAVLASSLQDVPTQAGVRRVSFGTAGMAAASPRSGARSGADAPTGAEPDRVLREGLALRDGLLLWKGEPLIEREELSLRGEHNVQNAMAAAAVCLARGLDREAVRAALRSFAGVPHRLQEVARSEGVRYVNDSKATNVASTLVALAALAEGDRGAGPGGDEGPDSGEGGARANVHLILGGQGKGQDFGALRDAVAGGCRAVYLIGEDAPAIATALEGAAVPLHECGELDLAVAAASAAAARGDVVLLSPACASFDQFRDYEARGERFAALAGRR
jgi:UDP-N-acetylmuramoylalanine--D-glutamate ligase